MALPMLRVEGEATLLTEEVMSTTEGGATRYLYHYASDEALSYVAVAQISL